MDSLLLDQTLWDLCLDANGDIAVASAPYAVAQDVATAIRLFAGELWYDTAKGVPYFTQVLGWQTPPSLIKALFVAAAKSVPGVVDVLVTLAINDRTLTGQVRVSTSSTTALVTFVGDGGGILTFGGLA